MKMPVVAYCKKCKAEVPPGDICALCGRPLPTGSLRMSWTYLHAPVVDWLSWNSILRIMLPAYLVLAVLVFGTEWLIRGSVGVQVLLAQGLGGVLLCVAVVMGLCIFLVLLFQGREELHIVLDQKGVLVQTYLTRPTRLKCWLRMQPGTLFNKEVEGKMLVGEKHAAWQELKRLQVWPDKEKILLNNPKWWMVLAVHCLPDTYDDAVRFAYDRLKKRAGVMMTPPPDMLVGGQIQQEL